MFSSLKLGRVLGIDLFVHGTFWLLPALVFLGGLMSGNPAGVGMELAVIFALFGCVALHELGHAVAAGWYGVRTRDITLYPIGGVARLERMPEQPWPEIVIALAGPAVNVVIAAILVAVLLVSHPLLSLESAPAIVASEFLGRLLLLNVILVVFNMIPAFPMDGGRVFRAVVNLFTDRLTATRVAATTGAIAAIGLGVYGLYETNFMLMMVAGVVFMLGQAELAATTARENFRSQASRRPRYDEYAEFDTHAYRREPEAAMPTAYPKVRVVRRPDGWEFDPVERVWTEWRDGQIVRRYAGD